jgi:small redox-active disulfide protein 2
MDVKVLGPGCRNCDLLEARTREALDELGLQAEIGKVTDPMTIVAYGVLTTPGLVVDEQVVVAGKVPTSRQLTRLLSR